jgi:hypothetical protein
MMKPIYTKLVLMFCLLNANQCLCINPDFNSPVTFLKNNGQWNSDILFQGTSTLKNVYFLRNGLSFGQPGKEVENADGTEDHPFLVWNMKFVNPKTDLMVSGTGEKESVISYLSGSDESKWVIHPEEYSQLQYTSVFENIDLNFYGEGYNLKYDYIVHPGGDINSIKACYEGIRKLSLKADGELEVTTAWNTQLQKTPVAWQMVNGKQQPVRVSYTILNDTTFGFEAPAYNKNYDLVIDPLFEMVWSSYTKATGTSNNINYCFGSEMDKDGNVYLTGMVDGTFPTTAGAYSGPGSVYPDIFVAKFSSDGTTMLYGTYLPANSSEHGTAIAADDSGRAYVTGVVDLNFTGITDYPSTANAYQQVHNTGSDAFLTVLNPTGTGLVYSTFLGGTGSELAYGIALGGMGVAYLTGTTSTGNYPTKATSVFPSGDNDVFVAKFDISQSGANSLIYSTRIGAGSFSYCSGRGIAVNSAGNAFITGTVGSGFGTPVYPATAGAYATVYNTGQDNIMSFVTKLSANTPVTLDYSTFLAPGIAYGIAVEDASGDAFITGSTNTFAFPVTAGALQTVHAGNNGTDAFAVRMNATGTGVVYSTFLGGPFADIGTGIAVNSAGEAYVCGQARDSFPTSAGAYQPDNAGSMDFFAVHLNAAGSGYACGGSTFIGGSDEDYSGSFYDYCAPHISLRDHGGSNDTICMASTSHSQDFPTTPGVYGPVKVNSIADQPVFFKLTCVANTTLPVSAFTAPDSICPGTCIDFTNLSQNGTSYQWTFQGASVATSTDANPAGICYATPGSYAVSLVAINASGSDTVTIPDYITVYPSPPPQGILQNGDTLFANQGAVSYQWYYNGSIVNGATDYFYVAQQGGDFNVVATDANGCEVEAVVFNVVAGLTRILSGGGGVMVFPNPAKDKITIHSPLLAGSQASMAATRISMYDVIGEKVMAVAPLASGAGDEAVADVHALPAGMYILELSNGSIKLYGKFIKK